MADKDSRYKKLSKLLPLRDEDKGHSIAWHIKRGNTEYRQLFLYLLRRLEDQEGRLVIPMKSILHTLRVPPPALTYPLYKFQKADLLVISQPVKAKAVIIEESTRERWEELCSVLEGEL